MRASVYFDAACRHLFAWWEGEDHDPDSGMPHIVKAMACLAVLRDAQVQVQYTDDRPPPSPEGWIADLNDKAAKLLERYPEPVPPHTAASIAHDASEQAYREQLQRIQARDEAGMSDADRVIAACQDVAYFKGDAETPGTSPAPA